MTVLRRYVLLQVPEWVLFGIVVLSLYWWADLPVSVVAGLLVVWIAKDFALYPWLRASYQVDTRMPVERLVGKSAVATQALAPRGYVRVHGELWRAEATEIDVRIGTGTTVEVVGASGITLIVRDTSSAAGRWLDRV